MRTSAIVGERVQRPETEMVEAVVMVAFVHCPEIASKDCFESKKDDAVDGELSCLSDRARGQKSFLLDGVAISQSFRDISGQLAPVVFPKAGSNTTNE